MFQLNSYKVGVQLRWLAGNWKDWLKRNVVVMCFTFIYCVALPQKLALYKIALWYSAQVCLIKYLWREKSKKPLVCTNRVKRMLATYAALIVATVAAILRVDDLDKQALCLAAAHMLAPGFVLLANAINMPLERAINRWYIRDAKRMLREHPGLNVIGVTGSYGKTSTKFYLHKLLSLRYNVLMTPENYNTTLGVVRTIRENLKPFHEVFVCEMGARNVGDVKEICDIVRPEHGVITSIGPQHLESFKTPDNVTRTKFELADALPDSGVAFLNRNSEPVRVELERRRKNEKSARKVVTYGLSDSFESCGYQARDVRVSGEGTSFSVRFPDASEMAFETRLIGAHNVENVLAAIAVADFMGVPRGDIAVGVRRLEGVPHRLQLIRGGSTLIIDDAYNSNAAGAKAALDVLAMFDGCKILVTPGMVELGNREDELHEKFGAQAGAVCNFVVLVGKRRTKSILRGLTDTGYPENRIFVAKDLNEGLARVAAIDASGMQKVVLLENDLPDNY
ncbi:MAG: UDP-N-acetylmuramoyl-tripeptide--D-alanyl-D-alanine ligase [Synergistaceae bacterium]|nr:UDP-N-acetylmuramoyl-tripeptide--D-alanyl-D-alanine ligase [Synergistaceae bacterium]